jgi:hypothetical protein
MSETVKEQEGILQEADRIAGEQRSRDYGHPKANHERIAVGWSVILGVPVTAAQVALCMIWLKVAREINTPKRDNRVDIAGYAKCLDMIIAHAHVDAPASANAACEPAGDILLTKPPPFDSV